MSSISLKRVVVIGIIIGGVFGIAVALGMDALLGGTLGGWREAVAHDLSAFGKMSPDSLPVLLGVVIVIAFIGVVGAVFGAIFGLIIGKFFSIMK